MNLSTLTNSIMSDKEALQQLELVHDHMPKGSYVAAGFVRNRVWDQCYTTPVRAAKSDIDVVYFDPEQSSKSRDLDFESQLQRLYPSAEWQVRNQARMHNFAGFAPFKSLEDALQHWAETATAVGVRLTQDGSLDWITPFGLADLLDHVLRVTPAIACHAPQSFWDRLGEKNWLSRWPDLKIIGPPASDHGRQVP